MDDQMRGRIAIETWDRCVALLPTAMAAGLEAHPDDPKRIEKKQTDIMRLRILPTKKVPPRFWSSAWCFYEIGVGCYGGVGLNLGGIQFLQFSGQKPCGEGIWLEAVSGIIRAVASQRADRFNVEFTADRDAPRPAIFTRYNIPKHKYFPEEIAASDLAWLIQQTLPKFMALKETEGKAQRHPQ